MCAENEAVEAAASMHYLEPPRALDLEPATFEIPVSDAEIPDPTKFVEHWDKLEAAEHQATAEALKIRLTNDVLLAPTDALASVNISSDVKIPLTFGRIIALAGDFYTNREPNKGSNIGQDYAPICGALREPGTPGTAPLKRFENAVDSLRFNLDGYLQKITETLDHEHRTIDHARDLKDISVSKTYHEGHIEDHFEPDNCKLPNDRDYFDALNNSSIMHPSYNLMLSMYAWLAYTNVDHFGEDAVKAYCIGHASAMRLAAEAHDEEDPVKKAEKLRLAYVHEAFSAHYLTDLYSSGHLRPARRYLHAERVKQMAAAGLVTANIPLIGGQKEVPIWDYQGRYMHDDDCATGLLVRNEKGEQWIAYGDKQFFEPKNAVNRARAAHCLQESVDEVYNKGFLQGWNPIPTDISEDENSWKQYSSSFVAKRLMPQPMTALKSNNWTEAWGNCDVHNPAPLWIAGTPNDQDRVSDNDFTLRKDVNDHSNYARVNASPAPAENTSFWPPKLFIPSANENCEKVRDAPFRGDDQFARQTVMEGLLSGSFVQVQDLLRNVQAPEQGKLTCVNFWNPALVEIKSKKKAEAEIQQTFTIRNRAIDVVDVSELPATAIPIHWALQNNTHLTTTTLYAFHWVPDNDQKNASIVFGNTSFQSWSGGLGERQKLNLSDSWEARAFRYMKPVTLSTNLPVWSANLTRILSDSFVCDESDAEAGPVDQKPLQMLAISVLPDKKVQIAICDDRLISWLDSPFSTIQSLQSSCFGFAKAVNTGKRQKNLLLCNASSMNGKSKLELYEYKFEGAEDPKQTKVTDKFTKLECPITSKEEAASSVLVGDVLGVGSDQVVVISGDYNNPEIQLYARSTDASNAGEFSLAGRNAFSESDACGDKLIRPYLTALVPSRTGNGLDILRIAQYERKDGRKYIYFHTHVRSKSSSSGPKSVIWTSSDPSEVIDTLGSNKDGHYFHIKFISTRREIKSKGETKIVPAILEVFSWYGVIGVRMFAPSSPKSFEYDLDGQQPFLGQTSIGAGLGCSGDWGHGFLTWNSEDRWVDSNVFIPTPGSQGARGSWGMTFDDRNRAQVRGWDVENRPR